jgi:hypothetical protein
MMLTIVPHPADNISELLAQSRVQSAYFVVARRGKNASAHSSSARRRAISRRSQLYFELPAAFKRWSGGSL